MSASLTLAISLAAASSCAVHVFESGNSSNPASGFNRSEVIQCWTNPAVDPGSPFQVDADIAAAVQRAMRGAPDRGR